MGDERVDFGVKLGRQRILIPLTSTAINIDIAIPGYYKP
jgi:hypothetical protein